MSVATLEALANRVEQATERAKSSAGRFRPLPNGNATFGFKDGAYWFHTRLFNRGNPEERWLLVLVGYVVLFGLSAAVLQRLGAEVWLGLNLWAAFLHYAYDGMIWKLRRPDTARALGAVSAVT